jgi:hypothetical protein
MPVTPDAWEVELEYCSPGLDPEKEQDPHLKTNLNTKGLGYGSSSRELA